MITAQEAQRQLDLWLAASAAVASNQSYTIGGRSFTRVDAAEIRNSIDFWEAKLATARRGGRRMTIAYGVAE